MPIKSLPTNGAVIRVLREARGLTLEEVAVAAQITVSSLGNIETGRRDASVATLKKIADRLLVPLDAVIRCAVPAELGGATPMAARRRATVRGGGE